MTTQTIGSRGDAALLIDLLNKNRRVRSDEGFTFVGAGSYREVYLHSESNLVYKVGSHESNSSEAYNARRLRRKSTRSLPFELRIPHSRTYRFDGHVISVQEYVPNLRPTDCSSYAIWLDVIPPCDCGADPCYTDVHNIVTFWSGLDDIHSENVMIDDKGVYWLIDIAQ